LLENLEEKIQQGTLPAPISVIEEGSIVELARLVKAALQDYLPFFEG
jgi:hypothetical protein